MSPKRTDLRARVGELEATVSGLTQELVDANERIRRLEEVVGEAEPRTENEPGVLSDEDANGGGGSTRQMGDDGQPEEEAGSDLDDIIVA